MRYLLIFALILQSCTFYKFNNISLVNQEPHKVLKKISRKAGTSTPIYVHLKDSVESKFQLAGCIISTDSIEGSLIKVPLDTLSEYYYQEALRNNGNLDRSNGKYNSEDSSAIPQVHLFLHDGMIFPEGHVQISQHDVVHVHSMQHGRFSGLMTFILVALIIAIPLIIINRIKNLKGF